MKNILIITALLICLFDTANAQKGKTQTGVVENPNKTIARNLPDLTFDLLPTLGGGYGFEKVKGFPNKIKVSSSFIVKNIGFLSSKPCKVYAIINYQRPRTHSEIEQGVPADAWGKRVKFLLKIEFDNPNDELTFSNNLSAPNEFDLINF